MSYSVAISVLFRGVVRGRHGGVEKGGGWKTSRMTPLPKSGLGPPSYGTFSTPLRCQRSVFPVQKSTTEQTRSSFGGVQKFSGERVLWYVFLPPYVLHPPISRSKVGGREEVIDDFSCQPGRQKTPSSPIPAGIMR